MRTMSRRINCCLLAALMLASPLALAEDMAPAPAEGQAQQQNVPAPFKQEEIDALLAPIALYPDALLAQVLMASTYPLEVVQAARWSKSNSKLQGEAAIKAAEKEPWDVSVKSLLAFPSVLSMMNDDLNWTQKLGDAFLAQKSDVMGSVQRLRKQAKDAGNLVSNDKQVVKTEGQTIIIESAQPETIYVPAYNPTVVYGGWVYPAYPPYYYPPPPYYYPTPYVSGFAWGLGFVTAGAIFSNCNWGHSDIDIDVDRAVNIDRNFNRNNVNGGNKWQHNPQHRGGVAYRDQGSRERYGNRAGSADNRRDYRGYDNNRAGDRPSAGNRMAEGGDRTNTRNQVADRADTRDRATDRGGDRYGARDYSGRADRATAYDGVGSGRSQIDRGSASSRQVQRGGGGRSFGGGGRGGRR
jgi:uncharacterized membrane protein YgcG